MNRKILYITLANLLFLGSMSSWAQDNKIITLADNYSIAGISPELIKNASAVVRSDEMKFAVKDVNNARLEAHFVVTILNPEAAEYLDFAVYSDKFRKLENAEIIVYDANGKKTKSYSRKDMRTTAFGSGLVEDGEYTSFTVNAPNYPITIEQNYSTKFNGILEYPDSYIQIPGVSTRLFQFVAEIDNSVGLRYRTLNMKLEPKIITDKVFTTYTWTAENLAAVIPETQSGPAANYYAKLELAPKKFKMMNYEGDMTTWKHYGDWIKSLVGNDSKLNEKNAAFIRNLVGEASTDLEKAAIIYSYLQENMRYVSIQLGIGGWKPFSADFVQDKKYGDCKALSNYMKAALEAVNVKSIYALINAGENGFPASENFPSSPFNHIILCIPQAKDSVWLECTSSLSDFGVLGSFTENRKALLITEQGGVLVNTPASKPTGNTLTQKNVFTINEDWGGSVQTKIEATGEFKESMLGNLKDKSEDEKLKYFVRRFGWKAPDKFSLKLDPVLETPLVSNITTNYEQFYSMKIPSKIFADKRQYRFFTENIPNTKDRKQDFYFHFPYEKTDTTEMILPKGYTINELPKDKNISNEMAAYNSSYKWEPGTGKLTIITKIDIRKVKVPAAEYPKLLAFAKEVQEDAEGKLVIANE